MIARISVKGQMVIPEAIREQARLNAGDEVDVGCANGLVILRKRAPMTPARLRSLLLAGEALPPVTPENEATVVDAVARVRSRNRR